MTDPSTPRQESLTATRFVYLAPQDILVARVARKCMMQLCDALTALGVDLELIAMRIATVPTEPTQTRDIWDVYGIERRFRVTMVPTLLRQRFIEHRLSHYVGQLIRVLVYPIYGLRAHIRRRSDRSQPGRTVFYSRNYACALGLLPLRKMLGDRARIVLEIHVPPEGCLHRFLLRSVDAVACQSAALQESLVDAGILERSRSIGRHGGFSPQLTERMRVSRAEARQDLGWGPSDRVICYTGKVVWGFQEIELIVRMAEMLRDEEVRTVIVGGRADHSKMWANEISARGITNVEFVGFLAPADVLRYQMAADVLLSYYPSGTRLNDFRSPGKLFEYMASGTPAVAADYVSTREVISDGENGLLVPPDRPDLLAEAVRRLLNDRELADRLASQARIDVMSYTWTDTARSTLSLVEGLWNNAS